MQRLLGYLLAMTIGFGSVLEQQFQKDLSLMQLETTRRKQAQLSGMDSISGAMMPNREAFGMLPLGVGAYLKTGQSTRLDTKRDFPLMSKQIRQKRVGIENSHSLYFYVFGSNGKPASRQASNPPCKAHTFL